MSPTSVVIGSRGSDLALYQANFIKSVLVGECSCEVSIQIIKTQGDKIDTVAFDKMEGKGFFTKELEDALLREEIDLAVHSLKDLMTVQPDGLALGAVGYRADRREMLLIRKESHEGDGLIPVRAGGVIGTSSARRKCQIVHHNPDLKITDLRGNVPTRINKLRDGQYDAILVAAAGVTRLDLDLSDLDVHLLPPDQFLPAPAQGILGLQIRKNDARTGEIVRQLNSAKDEAEANAERGLLARFGGGCSLPLGVYSFREGDTCRITAVLGEGEGNSWHGLRRTETEATTVEELVEKAYTQLNSEKSKVCG